jgi:hypothetical protein
MNAEEDDGRRAGCACAPHSSGHVLRIPFGPGVARMRLCSAFISPGVARMRMRRAEGLDAEEEDECRAHKLQWGYCSQEPAKKIFLTCRSKRPIVETQRFIGISPGQRGCSQATPGYPVAGVVSDSILKTFIRPIPALQL